ncbi:histidine phosphatase family protein [Halomonas sp. Bachu 37]|uniref:histidine phosphatase family protein n=1 Tax=Halomonas kashgarensis TaxID=3084920 RepID=UPI00321780FA
MSNTFLSAGQGWCNRYLLMRHGHSQANQEGRIISTPERGLDAFGLSPDGHRQLDTLLPQWQWPTPTRIVHSDFLRTTETALRVADHFGLTVQAEPRLRERNFGIFEGGPDSRYPDVWARDAEDAEHGDNGVESVSSVARRMSGVVAELERTRQGETILLVSHGDPLQILLTALDGRGLSRHREQIALAPASVTPLSRNVSPP